LEEEEEEGTQRSNSVIVLHSVRCIYSTMVKRRALTGIYSYS
jgi:hypothetical protein